MHKLEKKHDEAGLQTERDLVKQFRSQAWRFVRAVERQYLCLGDIADPEPAKEPLQWEQPSIWAAIAIARHYGIPTRLLDWTHSAFIAAYFAACTDPEHDGAVWWFDQKAFESVLHGKWDTYKVPKGDNGQRAMERKAFDVSATPWISKIHHNVPFHRMEVQQGFFTACGRLDMLHDQAIEDLQREAEIEISRGRLIVPKNLKKRFFRHFRGKLGMV